MSTQTTPLPGRVWTGLALLIAAAVAYSSTFILIGGQMSRMSAAMRAPDPAAMSSDTASLMYTMALLQLLAAILGLLGLVLTVAGFIDYARRPRYDLG